MSTIEHFNLTYFGLIDLSLYNFTTLYTYTTASHTMSKSRILVVGTGGIGTMAVYGLEKAGLSEVTAVMRSNYNAAVKDGIDLDSVQWGQVKGFRPTASKQPSLHTTPLPHEYTRPVSIRGC